MPQRMTSPLALCLFVIRLSQCTVSVCVGFLTNASFMVSVEEAEMKDNSSLYTLTIWLVSKLWKVQGRRSSAGLIAGFAILQGNSQVQ